MAEAKIHHGKDLTQGSIFRNIISFSIPLLLANFLSTGYTIINTIWIGNTVGELAVGAVAVSFPIIFIIIAICMGIAMATTILVSQNYGAKNYSMITKIVNNAFMTALFLGILLSIIGLIVNHRILSLMHTPASILPMATSYLSIFLIGMMFMFPTFVLISALRGIGDTVTPLYFMLISTVINAILDPFLILGLGPFPQLGLNGAALASVIAQIVPVIIGISYINKKFPLLKIDFHLFKPDFHVIGMIFKIGFPAIIQQTMISIGMIFMTTFVNGYGDKAIAAFGAVSRIDAVAMMPAMSIAMAMSTLTGQSLGAKKPEKIKSIFVWGLIINCSIIGTISILTLVFGHYILQAFVHDPEVIRIGLDYFRIVASCYLFFAIMFVTNGIINGAGKTFITMIFTLVSLWLIRLPLAYFLSNYTPLKLDGVWLSMSIGFGIAMTVSFLYYLSGKWKTAIVIERPIDGLLEPLIEPV